MAGFVHISLGTFASNDLATFLRPDEIEGKSIADMIEQIVNQPWRGTAVMTSRIIRELSNGYDFKPIVGMKRGEQEKFLQAKPEDNIDKYLQGNRVRLYVIDDQIVY